MFATIALLAALAPPCTAPEGGTAAIVEVNGFKDRKGQLRIVVYPANEQDFLASARYSARVDTPLTEEGSMTVCVTLPTPGRYAVVALHDRDTNGKFGAFSDGVGFSNNPRLRLSKPKVAKVETVIEGLTPLSITLNYLQGFRPAPWPEKQTR